MYRCYVQMWIVVKIKVIVHKKCLVFCNSDLIHSLVWVKVSQILVNFKGNESTWNLRYFSFFKKECLKSLQNLHSRSKSELEKNIHKNKLKFRPFSQFFIFSPPPNKKNIRKWNEIISVLMRNCKIFFLQICLRYFREKKSFQFVSSLFRDRTEKYILQ